MGPPEVKAFYPVYLPHHNRPAQEEDDELTFLSESPELSDSPGNSTQLLVPRRTLVVLFHLRPNDVGDVVVVAKITGKHTTLISVILRVYYFR